MLTGVEPHFDVCEDYQVRLVVQSGKLPFIDNRWRQRSVYENDLANLLLDMQASRPDQRPDIDRVVERLREILVSR